MEYLAPVDISKRDKDKPSVFLAGSIEMGSAEDWQTKLAKLLIEQGYNVFNPRRKDWDSSWKQTINDPQFSEQVRWELDALEEADAIIMYFDPATKSPVSMLELGLYANSGKMAVICPEGFWRKGNVDIVCEKYDIMMYKTIEELCNTMK